MANGQIRYQIGFDVDQSSLNQIRTSLQQLQKLGANDLMKINNTSFEQAQQSLKSIRSEASKVENALEKAFNVKLQSVNIETFNQELVRSKTSIQQVYQAFSQGGAAGQAAFRNLSTQLLNVNVGLKESHALLDKMATTLANTVKWNIASGAINAVTRSIQQAWGYAQSLDTSLNDIRIVTGKSADEMAEFAVQANKAAQELGKTTTDYTNAALIYAQQGLSDEEVQARARITLKAANVTGQSTDAVSEQLTAVWNGYKVTAEEAELYIDRLAAVAATTASNLEELSTGMSKVASAAAALGVGEDQLAAQLSTIISATRQAPESVGTALRTVYARISDIKAGIDEDGVTLGNYSSKMAQLGISVLDMNGNLRDMGEVMEEIGGKWDTLTREQQVYLAQTMAGQRQYNNLLALFDNFEKYNEALNTAQNAAGTLQKQQDTYMESTKAHLNTLKASMEGVYDSLIDTDGINKIIDGLSKAAGVVENFVDGIGGGSSLLKSLGAIAVTVFNNQIAKSIETSIHNLQAATQQANYFKSAIDQAQQMQDKGFGDEYTQYLIKNQQDILQMAPRLSRDDYLAMQGTIQEMSNNSGQVDILNEKIDTLRNSFTILGADLDNTAARWGSLDDMLASADGVEIIKNNLNEMLKSYDPIQKKQEDLTAAFELFYKTASSGNPSQIAESFKLVQDQAQNLINELNNKDLFKFLPESAQKSITEANLKLQDLNLDEIGNNPQAINKVSSLMQDINAVISKEIQNIKNLIKNADEGELQGLRQKLADYQNALKKNEQTLDALRDKADQSFKVQNLVSLAGGITQVSRSISQLQNLGSIWKNSDLSSTQKITQTITNLAFSLPMLITGLNKMATAMGIANTQTMASTTLAKKAILANAAHAGSIFAVEKSAEGATIKIRLLNSVISTTPWGLAIAGAAAVVAALAIVARAQQQNREELIKTQQAIIEEENKKQEQIQTNKELYNSLEQLNKKYKDGQITRIELKSGVTDLINQYGLEGDIIKSLTQDYDDLTAAIIRNRIANAQKGFDSATTEKDAAALELLTSARKGRDTRVKGDNYTATFRADFTENDLIKQLLVNAGGKNFSDGENTFIRFETDFDEKSLVQFYNTLVAIKNEANDLYKTRQISAQEFSGSGLLKSIDKWLDQNKQAVEHYQQALADLEKYEIDKVVDYQGLLNVDDQAEYLQERSELIAQITNILNKNGDDVTKAADMADTYLRENFSSLYSQFGEASIAADKFAEKFEKTTEDVNQELGKLNQQQLAALLEMPDSVLKDWGIFQTIVDEISKTDFSNVHRLSDVNVMQQNAEQGYVSAKELQDTVSSGKNISTEMFNSLSDDMKEFFSRTADGTYKMTGDAKTFYEMVNNMKLDGFSAALHQIEQQQTLLQQPLKDFFSENNITYDDIDQSAVSPNVPNSMTVGSADYNDILQGAATGEATEELVNQQLAYLQAVSATNPALKTMVDQWREQIGEQGISMQLAEDIADKVSEIGDVTNQLDEKWEQVAYQMHEAMFPTDEDVDEGTLQNLSEIIQDTADEIEGLSKDLSEGTTRAARDSEEVAESILRFDDAIVDVTEHYDEWMAALTSGSAQDQAEAMDGLRDAYQDLLDLDGSSLSEKFLKDPEHLQLMQEAIDGVDGSYEKLMEAAQQDIAAQIGLDTTQFDIGFDHLMDLYYQGKDLDNLQVGASLNNEEFLAGLTEMINAAGMTAEQATDYLKSMGVDAEIVEQKVQGSQTTSTTGFNTRWVENPAPFRAPVPDGNGGFKQSEGLSYLAQNLLYEPNTTTVTSPKETSAFSLKVTSAHKSSGGGFKLKQAKHGSGSAGTSTKKSGGGGGGGGSKSKSTSTKDTKKPIEDTRDIYHDINIEIQQINRNLKRVQQQQDRLYGKQLLDNLNKQSKILDQHKEKLNEKLELQKWDLAQQRQILEGLDVTFDKYGNIANYMDVLGDKQAQVNALIAEENKLIEQYNAEADADAQKQIGDQITAQEKKVKEAEDEFKELQNKIKSYDSLREAMEDVVDDIEEATQKQIELNIQKFRMELEIRLDMGEAERDWNEFRRNVLEHSDVIKDTEFEGIFRDALQNLRDATSYFNVHGSKGSIQNLTEQLIATRNQIQAIDELGKSAIYGDNKAQAMEDLQSDLDELMDQMQDVESLIDDIDNAYLDTIDDVQDQFDKQIEDYEYIGDLIDHDISLLQLLYGDKNYDAMEKYYETLERNNLNQIDSLRQQRDFWGQQWEAAAARGDIQAAKQFEQNFREALQNLNQAIEDAAQTIQDKYINAIDKVFDELDKKISNGMGTDYLGMQWDLMNKNADEYLDTINSAFAIQETERKYQNAVTDAKSIKNQQALKQLMDEQLGILRNKEKITQYDIDRAEKLLQVEQARIALEDAQAAKTTMRLKRDSQGNYSYEYMADEGAIGEAEADLAQAQNDLYNFDKERYQSNLDDMLAAWKDFQSEYKDIVEDISLSEEERVAKLALLRDQYGEYINDKTAENAVIRGNLMQSAFADLALLYETDVENYNNMSLEEQNILMGELVPAWTSGIQQMSDTVAGEGGFIPTCQEAFDNITEATLLYEDELNNMAQTAGTNFENIKNGVDETAAAFEDLIENNEELTARLRDEMDAVSLLRAQVHALVEEYQAVYDAAKLAAAAVHDFIQAQQAEAAAAAEAEQKAKKANANNTNSTTPTVGNRNLTSSTNTNNGLTKSSANKNTGGSTNNEFYNPTPNDEPAVPTALSVWSESMSAQREDDILSRYVSGKTSSPSTDELRKLHKLLGFATGGYTGDWIDNNGRLAVLHQKELVLNEQDTKNILDSVSIMRSVMSNLSGNIAMRLGNIRTGLAQIMPDSSDGVEQNVHIDANFPNVNSKKEIEDAFNDLVSLAAQRAMRK